MRVRSRAASLCVKLYIYDTVVQKRKFNNKNRHHHHHRLARGRVGEETRDTGTKRKKKQKKSFFK